MYISEKMSSYLQQTQVEFSHQHLREDVAIFTFTFPSKEDVVHVLYSQETQVEFCHQHLRADVVHLREDVLLLSRETQVKFHHTSQRRCFVTFTFPSREDVVYVFTFALLHFLREKMLYNADSNHI